jgi:hypothetical protein
MTSHYTTEQREILKKKGVYPYEYMDGFDKLEKTSLQPKSKFFSSLTNEDVSDTDYRRAQNAWNTFGMETMRDYHDLYLKTDVVGNHLLGKSGGSSYEEDLRKTEKTHIPRNEYPGYQQNPNVRLSL